MRNLPIAALLLSMASNGCGAIGYSRFVHPSSDYVLEYPADWKVSIGLQLIDLSPPGRDAERVMVSLERHPFGKDSPPTAEAYINELISLDGILKRLESRKAMTVAGRQAERLIFTELGPRKDESGQALPGPLLETYIVIPSGKSYYVLMLRGMGEAYSKALPEFERIAQRLRLGARP